MSSLKLLSGITLSWPFNTCVEHALLCFCRLARKRYFTEAMDSCLECVQEFVERNLPKGEKSVPLLLRNWRGTIMPRGEVKKAFFPYTRKLHSVFQGYCKLHKTLGALPSSGFFAFLKQYNFLQKYSDLTSSAHTFENQVHQLISRFVF